MHLKVIGGTVRGKPLCPSCRNATYIKGASQSQIILQCAEVYPHSRLAFEAYECSAYQNANTPPLEEMKKIAWTLDVDRNHEPVGFFPPTNEEGE